MLVKEVKAKYADKYDEHGLHYHKFIPMEIPGHGKVVVVVTFQRSHDYWRARHYQNYWYNVHAIWRLSDGLNLQGGRNYWESVGMSHNLEDIPGIVTEFVNRKY